MNESCLKKIKRVIWKTIITKSPSNKLSPKTSLISVLSPVAWVSPACFCFFKGRCVRVRTDETMPVNSLVDTEAGGLKFRTQTSLHIETLSQNEEKQNPNELPTCKGWSCASRGGCKEGLRTFGTKWQCVRCLILSKQHQASANVKFSSYMDKHAFGHNGNYTGPSASLQVALFKKASRIRKHDIYIILKNYPLQA